MSRVNSARCGFGSAAGIVPLAKRARTIAVKKTARMGPRGESSSRPQAGAVCRRVTRQNTDGTRKPATTLTARAREGLSMPWIKTIPMEAAGPELRAAYEAIYSLYPREYADP